MYNISICGVIERRKKIEKWKLTFAVVMIKDELFQDLGKSIPTNKEFLCLSQNNIGFALSLSGLHLCLSLSKISISAFCSPPPPSLLLLICF